MESSAASKVPVKLHWLFAVLVLGGCCLPPADIGREWSAREQCIKELLKQAWIQHGYGWAEGPEWPVYVDEEPGCRGEGRACWQHCDGEQGLFRWNGGPGDHWAHELTHWAIWNMHGGTDRAHVRPHWELVHTLDYRQCARER